MNTEKWKSIAKSVPKDYPLNGKDFFKELKSTFDDMWDMLTNEQQKSIGNKHKVELIAEGLK